MFVFSICISFDFHLCLLFSNIFLLSLFDIIPVAYCADDSLDLELSEAGPPGGTLGGTCPPISCGKRGGLILIQAMVAPGGSGTGSSRGGSYRSPASRWGGQSRLGVTLGRRGCYRR
jgi:hypothetical protein